MAKMTKEFIGIILFAVAFVTYKFAMAYKNSAKLSQDLVNTEKLTEEFMAKISHELKIPIFGIINISHSLLQREVIKNLSKESKDILLINKASNRLSKLVGDISDFMNLKSGKLSLELGKVDLKICVGIVLDIFSYLIDKKRVRLINDVKENVFIFADEDRMRQILNNLIECSMNNLEEGFIRISSVVDEGITRIYIEDNCSEADKTMVRNIFNGYNKTEHEDLALTISKQLAEAMGGTLVIDSSKEHEGIRFILEVPSFEESHVTYKSKNSTAVKSPIDETSTYMNANLDVREGKDFTILIVDDQVENIYILKDICVAEGYDVLTAMSAEEAMEKLISNSADIMILDTILNKISGIEVCRKVRENYNLIELPILITTSSHKSDDLLLGLEAGANDYINKPFNDKEIKTRLKTLVNMKRSVREAVKSEMAFLHAQIKPHFLFNALSTIMSFCYTDGEKAANLIAQFSKYLRTIFDIEKDSIYTTIYNELDLVEAYVAIEKARFGERISVTYEVDETLTSCLIPSLTIEPLVENAIKHGIYDKETDGKVEISINEIQGKIVISVFDNGIGMSRDKINHILSRTGEQRVGIRNVYDRVKSIKGSEFYIESEEQIYTKVIIKLPKM